MTLLWNRLNPVCTGLLALMVTACSNPLGSSIKIAETFRPGILVSEPVSATPITGFSYGGSSFVFTKNTAIATLTPVFNSGTPTGFSVAPSLPAGLVLNPTTGVISGTPSSISAPSSYTVTATGGSGNASTVFSLSVQGTDPAQSTVAESVASVTADGTSSATVTVTLRDATGNPVPGQSVSLASSRGATDTIQTLSGTTNISGVATFRVTSTTSGSSIFTATDASDSVVVTDTASVVFLPGPATSFILTGPNSATAGTSQTLTVAALDAHSNPASTFVGTVTLSSSDGAAMLGAPATLTAGVGAFSVSLRTAGSQTVTASSGALSATTSAVTISPASLASLQFSTQPSSGVSGITLPTQPVVRAYDAYQNLRSNDFASLVTLSAFSSNTCSGTPVTEALSVDANPIPVSAGTASFSGVALANPSVTRLKATSGAVSVCSDAISIASGQISSIEFQVQPASTGNTDTPLAIQPAVRLMDVSGNVITDDSSTLITLSAHSDSTCTGAAIASSVSGASATASSGVATFSSFQVLKTDAIRIKASDGIHTACSDPITIAPGAAHHIAFATQPSGTNTAGSAFGTQPVVAVYDFHNNLLSGLSTGSVSLAISAGSIASGGTAAISGGSASFSGLQVNSGGTNLTFTATYGALSATSNAFTVNAGAYSAAQSEVSLSANAVDSGSTVTATLTAKDAYGNPNPSGLPALGSIAFNSTAIGGTGTFGAITNAGTGVYTASFTGAVAGSVTIGASISGTSVGTSANLTVNPGTASTLAFTTQPSSPNAAGSAFGTQPVVTVRDAQGNTVTSSSASITIAIGTNPGAGALSGTATVSAVNGVATFSGLSINKSGTGYTLSATSAGLSSATSSTFTIQAGAATTLAFTTQPSSPNTAGSAFGTQPVVTVQDSNGNTVTTSTASITIAIGTNPGSGALSGTATVSAVNGIATFSGLSINKSGIGYTLSASSAGLTSATSSTFTIQAGAATTLAFTTQPSSPNTAGSAFGTQPVVTVQDSNGNTVTTSTASITIAIGTNPGPGTLSGTATVSAVNGIATFSGLSINKTGTGYTLSASSTGLASATSSTFNINPGVAASLVFTTQPAGATAGSAFTSQPAVIIRDSSGNTVTSGTDATATLTMSIASGTGTLSGTTSVTAVGGVAIWSGLSINTIGSKTLQVSKPNLIGSGGGGALTANSNSFYNEVAVTFQGWTGIKAVGARTPAAGATDLVSAAASVTLTWSAVTVAPTDTISSYNIYRSTSSGGQNYASPLVTGISASTRTYTDSNVTGGTTYYYTIAPVMNGSGSAVEPQSASDKEIKIIAPPANMVLLHRWAANREMCVELMGKTSDRTNHYRCSVATGANAPPGTGNTGFVDLGSSIFVDTYGQGCNYTATNTCTDSTVNGGAAAPCIGTRSTPVGNVTAPSGTVYYSRANATCYINTSSGSGTSWTDANSTMTANRRTMGANSPGLPPLVWVSQLQGHEVCGGQTVSGFAGTKRLLRRKEQLMVSAWDSSWSHATIDSTEYSATSLLTTNGCNTNSANGLTFDDTRTPGTLDTLPSTLTLGLKTLRIGNTTTTGCVSRYGAQDMVGNVLQWVSEQITCTSLPCTGRTSTTDATNDDLNGVLFNGTQGPNTSNLLFSTNGRIQFPLGIPIISASFAGDGVITWSGSGTANEFHGDRFFLTGSATRGMLTGGATSGTYGGTNAGRYLMQFVWAETYSASNVGFRCALQAD